VSRSPLEGIELLLIDGNNLLHRLSGSADTGAQRLLLGRLRGALPAELRTVLMLDGHPASGTSYRERIARNLEIRHAGSATADDALVASVRDQPPGERAGIVIVSDDRSLVERVRTLGARTQRLAWLESLMGGEHRSDATGISRPLKPQPPTPPDDDEHPREPWKPGRGATRKRGNPRRQRR
jgi:hypothetical protein